jgi:hypothetical protein
VTADVAVRRVLLVANTTRDQACDIARAFVKSLSSHRIVERLLAA